MYTSAENIMEKQNNIYAEGRIFVKGKHEGLCDLNFADHPKFCLSLSFSRINILCCEGLLWKLWNFFFKTYYAYSICR